MKQFHPPKWLIYVGIGVFAFMISLFIVLSVTDFIQQNQNALTRQQKKEAERFKKTADSISMAVAMAQDSLKHEIVIDSIAHVKEKESLSTSFKKKISKYETRMAAIDSLSDIQLNGSFSIREMLSDSSSKLW